MLLILVHFLVAMIAIIGFWSPNIVGHAIMGAGTGPPGTFVLVGIVPAFVIIAGHQILFRALKHRIHGRLLSLNMLLAIWISGPCCMMISATFSGSGFANPDAIEWLVLMTALFPFATFSMSAFTMALGALVLVSVYLLVYIVVVPKRRPQLTG